MDKSLLYFLFPILFMFHELEEIAYLPDWSQKQLTNPKIPNKLKDKLSTNAQSFTLMVLEEYFLLVLISVICFLGNYPDFYLALITAYNIHIIGHIFQTIYLKSYVPGIVLGIVSFVILSIQVNACLSTVNVTRIIIFVPVCLGILILNLLLVHKIFD